MTLFFLVLAGYLIGAIPTGVILTRLSGGEDIRNAGISGRQMSTV